MVKKIILFFGLLLLAVGGYALYLQILLWHDERPLFISWDGALNDKNFRDVGESLNACLTENKFQTGHLLRANMRFSGWSCRDVGDPQRIFSLSFDPEDPKLFFCRLPRDDIEVGETFPTSVMLNNLEFALTWQDTVMRQSACTYLKEVVASLGSGQRTLLHCDAGRDRTGTFSALLVALATESRGVLDETLIQAIECDYRKSPTLAEHKYGRMEKMIAWMREDFGGVQAFAAKSCGIGADEVSKLAENLLQKQ